MYVLNLDAGRIFWLTTILLLLVALSFFIGFLIGREKTKVAVEDVTQKNKMIMDEILSKLDDKNQNEDDYQFYELISPDQASKNKGMEEYDYVQPHKIEKNENDYKESDNENQHLKKKRVVKQKPRQYEPMMELGDPKISSKRPYAVQVASYKRYRNAKALRNYLNSEQYPSYIIKSSVHGVLYYRVRIGPFASKTLSLKVLEMVKRKKNCENSFITAK